MYSGFRLGAMIVASFGFLTVLGAAASAEITVYQAPEAPKVQALKETPSLAPMVNAGQLPKVQDRLPQVPRVSVSGPKLSVGKHGGELRMLVTRDKDVRLLNVYGYARLVGYNEALEVEPDLLERLDVEDGRSSR